MRPVELTVDGFRSYGKPTTFTWEDRRLVGIVGPIGSGKSSILDAVAFALYSRVPAFERDVKRLINQRRDECHVGLTFDVDGRRFTVERALRRKGAAGHVLREVTGGDRRLVSDRATEIGDTIEGLLGLDFDAFRRSVLLAQNRFAEFLQATPTQRDAVLEGVFPRFADIGSMRDHGKAVLGLVGARLETATLRRRDLAADRQALEDARTRRAAEEDRAQALEALAEPLAAIEQRLAAARAAAKAATERVDRLSALAREVPAREASEPVVAAAADAEAVVGKAESARKTAADRLDAARSRLAEVLADVGGRESLSRAATLVERLDAARAVARREGDRTTAAESAVVEATTALAAAEERLAAAEEAAGRATETAGAAAEAVAIAERELHEARHRSMALTLRSELQAGETCPVCAQAVEDVPGADPSPEVDAAERALGEARRTHEQATDEASKHAADVAAAAEAVTGATRSLETTRQRSAEAAATAAEAAESVVGVTGEVTTILGDGEPGGLLAQRQEIVARADQDVADAVADTERAAKDVDAARMAAEDAKTKLAAMVRSLAALAGRLEVDVELAEDPDLVRVALGEIREAWMAAKTEADEEGRLATEAAEQALAERGEVLESVGLAPDADVSRAAGEAKATLAGTDREIETLEGRLAELAELEARESDALGARDRLDRIVGDLTPSKFLRFVLDEKRRVLASLGSQQLEDLSAGRYRFTDDGHFEIVDLMAAERPRSAASLSGGETFLASLALALALAEMVGREGGRLDAFFLDEGFGSLDPEHMDLAMDGVERLVAGATDRLVVVVSHVPALRERIEDLIVLDKDPSTGDTIVRRGTGPGEG